LPPPNVSPLEKCKLNATPKENGLSKYFTITQPQHSPHKRQLSIKLNKATSLFKRHSYTQVTLPQLLKLPDQSAHNSSPTKHKPMKAAKTNDVKATMATKDLQITNDRKKRKLEIIEETGIVIVDII
jgi:hypothetical protein